MNGLREKAHGKNAPCSRTKPKDMQRKKAEEQLYTLLRVTPIFTENSDIISDMPSCHLKHIATCSDIYPLVNQHNYGKSPFLIGKSTINHHFQWFFVCLPEGTWTVLVHRNGIWVRYLHGSEPVLDDGIPILRVKHPHCLIVKSYEIPMKWNMNQAFYMSGEFYITSTVCVFDHPNQLNLHWWTLMSDQAIKSYN